MGEARRRRKHATSTREKQATPTILMEMAREIDAALQAEDEVAAAEKLVDAIALFGCDTTLDALDSVPKLHIMDSESSDPFWKTMVRCFIAKQPGQRLDESFEAYNARVATALSELQHLLFSSFRPGPGLQDHLCVTHDDIKVGDSLVRRLRLAFTREGFEHIVKRMTEEIKAGRAAAKQPSPIKSGLPWGSFRGPDHD
jgi:hypothetical protein